MMADKADAWISAEDYVSESEIAVEARIAAAKLGVNLASLGIGAALHMFAVVAGACTALEVETGMEVSGLWSLDDISADGVFTSIDSEAEFRQQARRVFIAAGALVQHTRLIVGRALGALPRMAVRDYDMMVLDVNIVETSECLDHAVHTLRLGGVIAFAHALWHNQVADLARRSGETAMCRKVAHFFIDSPDFTPVILPAGDGLVVAVKC